MFCDVEPKRLALEAANAQLSAAQEKLKQIQNKIQALEEALAKLTAEFEQVRLKNENKNLLKAFFQNITKLLTLQYFDILGHCL